MKAIYLIIFLFGFKAVYAHNPDLSSLVIYEQNGRSILLIKSSLTAFEGEIDYIFGKGAYKTPEEFNQLVLQHFQKNCVVIANGDTIKLTNIQVQLGHETNLFAELDNVPKTIKSFYVSNALFKDMYNNKCELILTLNGLPQKQYILNNGNQQEVTLKVKDDQWEIGEAAKANFSTPGFLTGLAVLFTLALVGFAAIKRKGQVASLMASN